MSNYVYQYNWPGPRTGWNYRLEITPFSLVPLSNPTTVILPNGCINTKKLTKRYEKYHYGNLEVPKLEVEVKLSEIDDDVIHADLHDCLLNPVQTTVVNYYNIDNTIYVGPLFKLYIKFNKNSDEASNIYRPIFEGSCRFDTNFNHEAVSNVVTLTALDLHKCILDSFNSTHLWLWANGEEPVEADYYVDIHNPANNIIQRPADGQVLKLDKYQLIDIRAQAYGQALYRLMTRSATAVYSISTVFPKFYKQLFDGTGGIGTQLGEESLNVISTIPASGLSIGDIGLYSTNDNSLSKRYPDSMWDYYTELSEFSISKAVSIPGEYYQIPLYGTIGAARTVNLSKDFLNQIAIKPFNAINKTTASCYESYSDDPYSDLDHVEIKTTGSRNAGSETYPVMFNNTPSAVRYLRTNVISGRSYWMARFPKILNLLYFDTLPTGGPDVPIRVHEYCIWDLGDGLDTSDLPGCSIRAFNYLAQDPNDPSAYIESMQKEPGVQTCLAYWLANAYNALFKSADIKTLNIEVFMDEVTQFTLGGDVGFVWWDETVTFRINLQDIHPHYKVTDKFYMMSSELDFDKEVASLELMSRTV